jgi:hypothetical protein
MVIVGGEGFLNGSGWRSRLSSRSIGSPSEDGVQPGPVMRAIQACHFAVLRGEKSAYRQWRAPVYGR